LTPQRLRRFAAVFYCVRIWQPTAAKSAHSRKEVRHCRRWGQIRTSEKKRDASGVEGSWTGNYSAGGSKGPTRPLGGVRGVPALLPHPAAGGGARERRPE